MKYMASYDNGYVYGIHYENNKIHSHYTMKGVKITENSFSFTLKDIKVCCKIWNSDNRHDYPTIIILKEE